MRIETRKVCLASDWYYPKVGGVESHIDYLAEGLCARGNEVHILTCRYRDSQGRIAQHDAAREQVGITVHRIKGHTVKRWGTVIDPRMTWAVNGVIKKEKFELIHAHSIYSPIAMVTAYAGKTLRNIPTLATNHSLWGENWLMGSLFQRMLREGFTRLDALVAVSSAVKKDMGRFGVSKPVFVIPSGVDCGRFYPDARSREETRRLLGYGENDIVISTVGRLVPRKKMHELIQIMPDLARRYNAKLMILGDGPEKSRLTALSHSLGISGHIRFAGFVANPRDYLNASDIFALCSVEEALGMSILEAMACELPVVAKNVNGIRDILSGSNSLPHVEDAAGIKKNIEFLISNEELRSKIAKNNRKYVLSNFAWGGVCERILDIYSFIEQVAEADAHRYYNMKLARMGRIVKRLMLIYEKNNSSDG